MERGLRGPVFCGLTGGFGDEVCGFGVEGTGKMASGFPRRGSSREPADCALRPHEALLEHLPFVDGPWG